MKSDGIEFLHADGDAELDEELPSPTRRRAWVGWAVGAAVVAIGVVAVVRATGNPPPPTAVPPPTRYSSSAAPFTPDRAAVPTRQADGNRTYIGLPTLLAPRACPQAGDGLSSCTTSRALPAPLYTAVRAQFPSARPVVVTSEIVRPAGAEVVRALWSRQFTAEVGTTTLHVVISAGIDYDRVVDLTFDDGIRARTETWHQTGSLAVQVFTSSPSGHEPSAARLERLARDPRLVRID